MIKLISILFITFMPLWVEAYDIPDFSANYSINIDGIQAGQLKRTLSTQKDSSRIFKSETQAKGIFAFFKPDLVEETSIFKAENNSIIPQSYLYQRTKGKKDKYLKLNFDWANKQVHIDDKKHPWSLDIETKILDKLVYQLALMTDLAENKKQFNYQIADGGKIKIYNIIIIDHEVVTTPLGKIKTVKLMRQRDKASRRQTTLWCAPALDYLPVKLEHIEKDGAVFTAELRHLTGVQITDAFQPATPNLPSFGAH